MIDLVGIVKQAAMRSLALVLALLGLFLGLTVAATPADAQDAHSATQGSSSVQPSSLDLSPWLSDTPIKHIYLRQLAKR